MNISGGSGYLWFHLSLGGNIQSFITKYDFISNFLVDDPYKVRKFSCIPMSLRGLLIK